MFTYVAAEKCSFLAKIDNVCDRKLEVKQQPEAREHLHSPAWRCFTLSFLSKQLLCFLIFPSSEQTAHYVSSRWINPNRFVRAQCEQKYRCWLSMVSTSGSAGWEERLSWQIPDQTRGGVLSITVAAITATHTTHTRTCARILIKGCEVGSTKVNQRLSLKWQ